MEYDGPKFIEPNNITIEMANARSDEDVIQVALSAIYHCEIEVAGDTLFDAYQKISGANREFLSNITLTFFEMRDTIYRFDDFINEMTREGGDRAAITSNIEDAEAHRKKFR